MPASRCARGGLPVILVIFLAGCGSTPVSPLQAPEALSRRWRRPPRST